MLTRVCMAWNPSDRGCCQAPPQLLSPSLDIDEHGDTVHKQVLGAMVSILSKENSISRRELERASNRLEHLVQSRVIPSAATTAVVLSSRAHTQELRRRLVVQCRLDRKSVV